MHNRRKLVSMLACLVAVPILYAASSGPLLLITLKCDPQRTTYARMLHFYRPLLKLAAVTHLEQPLSAYLGLWGLRILKVAGKVGAPQYGTLSIIPTRPMY